MYHEQDNSQTVYRLWAIALGVAIVVVTICGSLALVWMRQQVSVMAASASRLQLQIAEAERESAGLDARLARALSPQFLATRLPEGLRPSSGNQIVWSGRPQQLAPAPGFDNAALLAGTPRPAVRAGSAVAATTAPAVPSRAAQGRSHLVDTSGSAAPAAVQETPFTVTFDQALLGVQPQAGASARR